MPTRQALTLIIPSTGETKMTVAGHRHERVAEEIRHELGIMVAGELKGPRIEGLVTVTEARVTPDLKHARVYVSVMGSAAEQKSTISGLFAAVGYIRHELTERLQLRRAPEIHFILDHSEEYGQRIETLLRQAKNPPRE
jgi:ribosome-binding factor A